MSARNPIRRVRPLHAAVLLAVAVYSATAVARESLEDRVARIETLVQSQGLIDMLTQLQQLQREVQQLRGDVEVQGHKLEELQQRQRDIYLDIDRRLQQQGGAPVGTPAGTLTPGMPTTSSAPTAPPAALPGTEVPVTPSAMPTPGEPGAAPPAPVMQQQGAVASPDEQGAYEQALNILREGRYADAAQAYRQFLTTYPNGRYADNAQYWLAETQYVTRQFQQGLDEFGKVVSLYPNSPKVPDALLKMGYIHYEMGDWKAARQQLESLVQRYPDSTAARLAGERLQRMSREGR